MIYPSSQFSTFKYQFLNGYEEVRTFFKGEKNNNNFQVKRVITWLKKYVSVNLM